ncbi:exodeoxyribonuclease III [Aureococcus anophagefferens]|nr:exodeoxyribonuclease III [Aureococcus anophagefferens]
MSCFSARLDSAALVTSLIECLIEEKRSEVVAHIAIDAAGLELHVVGRSKSTHATLTLPVSCFAAFDCVDETGAPFVRGGDQEPIAFSVDVRALVECLKLFGAAGADLEVSLSYAPATEVFKLTLEEPGAFTSCDVHVLEDSNDLEGATDMAGAFRDAPTAAKTPRRRRRSATHRPPPGSVGCVQIDVPRDAFVVFEAPEETRSWTYQTQAFHGMKALRTRTDPPSGSMLSLQWCPGTTRENWQCEKCHSWQHERCVSIGGGGVPSPYLCHECAPVAAPKCVLARAAARPLEPEKSQYEIERDERIKRNADFLASLGLGGGLAPTEEKKKVKKPAVKKRKAEPREPRGRARRPAAAKDYVAEDGGGDDGGEAAAWTPRAARAPRGKRLPAAAVAELERQCGESNRDKVMVVLEKCAAGLGVGAVAWPSPFLCDAELPMTLGSDVEMLKYCGKRLECAHGADISNGWAYSHAFGKLKAYQTALLGEAAFDAPPLSELDDDAVEALVPDHIKAVCAARP